MFKWNRLVGLLLLLFCLEPHGAPAPPKPNILFILADDLGYGDVRSLNPKGKIPTPHLDRLAAGGMIFADAHSSSAVCTPTRYGVLTGRYNWRSRLKQGVQGGMSPPLIEPGRLTMPAFLRRQGYHTACIGKWHLGMDWPLKPGAAPFDDTIEKGEAGWRVDFSKPISGGPNSVGFDYYFGIAGSLDMVPYTYIENDRVTRAPTEDKDFPMMHGRAKGKTRRGPAAPGFDASDVLPTLLRKAIDYLEHGAAESRAGRPFFLYWPLNAPHTPIAPTKEWQGRSGLNSYADFVMETDASVGLLLEALDRFGLAENTLVIFTSDNGCSPEAKFDELLTQCHNPSAQFRGTKADLFEGGHRVPFIARWPGRVKPGSRSDQLICLNDLFATCAEILGQKLPHNAAEDSVSFLPALEGRTTGSRRKVLVHHSINGSFAIREGKWKLGLCADSGGWSSPRPGGAEGAQLAAVQLYDLAKDNGEINNVQASHPQVVARLTKLLEKHVADGRSTPGPPQANTTLLGIAQAPVRGRGTDAAEPSAAPPGPKGVINRFADSGQERPNFLFLLTDDQTFRALGTTGGLEVRTPNLDLLAKRGMLFTRCFNQGGWSGAVCIPSRMMLNTGQTLWKSRPANGQGIPADVALWGETLGRAGYDTFMAGKWHIPDAALRRSFKSVGPLTGGFLASTTNGGAAYYRPVAGNSWSPDDPKWNGHWLDVNGRPVHSSVRIADSAIDYLKTTATTGTNAFFMYVGFNAPHDPRQSPGNFLGMYPPTNLRLPPNFLPKHPFLIETSFDGRDEILAPYPRTPEVVRVHLQEYYSIISHLDEQIGRVLEALESSGKSRNTVVIFTSDQGLAVGQHGLFGKQNLYEHSLRMPFILAGPGIPKGRRHDALFNMQSLFATTCDMAGIAVPDSVQFPSIVPLITGAQKHMHESLYAAFLDRQRAVRTVQWKLIRTPGQNQVQLFDVKKDPWETNNLASNPKHASTLDALDARLWNLMQEMADPMPAEKLFGKPVLPREKSSPAL